MILIILATISINAVLGEDGLIKRAEKAGQMHGNGVASEQDAIDTLLGEYANALYEEPTEPEGEPIEPEGKPLTSTVTSTNHTGTEAEDTLGNPVYIPGGFKIADDSGETVQEGIVIEDEAQNQFVWIPVSNIDGSQNNPIKIDETNEVVITLGRYTFARTQNAETGLYEDGTPTIVQKGSEWDKTTSEIDETYKIADSLYVNDVYHYELATKMSGKNEVAKSLSTFVESVEENHGYYFARYEASYASGSSTEDYKPASKVSTNKTEDSWIPTTEEGKSTVGYLWNYISQTDASKVCQNMYSGDSYVKSDLINSYAWDTAIVYIQAMGNVNYANQGRSNVSLLNTGTTGDEKCKIFDMAGNVGEITTEYCTSFYGAATNRGGIYTSDDYPAYRNLYNITDTYENRRI